MRSNRVALIRTGIALLLVPMAARAQATIVVSPNVHVSASQAGLFHNEVLLSASPKDPNVLVACALAGATNIVLPPGAPSSLGDRGSLFVSTDRGRSWHAGGPAATDSVTGDNHCIIAPDGRMHFVGMIVSRAPSASAGAAGGLRTRIIVRSSSDSGRTWREGRVDPPDIVDRQYLLLDDTGGRYNGRLYLSGSTFIMSLDSTRMGTNTLALWRSLDGGQTFERPLLTASVDSAVGGLQSWNPVLLSDGTVVFPFVEWLRGGSPTPSAQVGTVSTSRIKVITSRDGGASFGKAQQVARFALQNPSRFAWAHTPTISVAVDRSAGPFRDRLYVSWF
jgi:hypothetical protein